jgi:glycosyltransferase involved in cell wall biosynthesis
VVRKKNFHSLLALVQKDSDMELVIAGRIDDPGYAHTIHQMALCMGIVDNIRLIGPVSEEEKAWYFENCCAFALPSISEGFGLPVIEAMSVGKPLFLSNKTALPEIAGNVAFYFPDFSETRMQETFRAGMKQYKLFNMSEDIINKGKSFCWRKTALQYLDVYRSTRDHSLNN